MVKRKLISDLQIHSFLSRCWPPGPALVQRRSPMWLSPAEWHQGVFPTARTLASWAFLHTWRPGHRSHTRPPVPKKTSHTRTEQEQCLKATLWELRPSCVINVSLSGCSLSQSREGCPLQISHSSERRMEVKDKPTLCYFLHVKHVHLPLVVMLFCSGHIINALTSTAVQWHFWPLEALHLKNDTVTWSRGYPSLVTDYK